MRKTRKASVKENLPEGGMRKVWVTLAVIGALLVGLTLAFAFHALTDAMWIAWCASLAGSGGLYATANVLTKQITKEQ